MVSSFLSILLFSLPAMDTVLKGGRRCTICLPFPVAVHGWATKWRVPLKICTDTCNSAINIANCDAVDTNNTLKFLLQQSTLASSDLRHPDGHRFMSSFFFSRCNHLNQPMFASSFSFGVCKWVPPCSSKLFSHHFFDNYGSHLF